MLPLNFCPEEKLAAACLAIGLDFDALLADRQYERRMDSLVELHHILRDAITRVRTNGNGRNTQAVHGTPITPKRFLPQLDGGSFCVSYFRPDQTDDVVPLVGADGILLLDNGAYSAWKKGLVLDDAYWDGFWAWAVPILDRLPQAVAIVPDVIDGTVAENLRQVHEAPTCTWGRESQLMVVWHLNEPLELLAYYAESFGRIAFGSAGQFRQVGSSAWHSRVAAAFKMLDQTCSPGTGYPRPRIHMLRGLGQLALGVWPFDSADSANIAINHNRQSKTTHGDLRVAVMRGRIESGAFPAPPTAMWPAPSTAPAPAGPSPGRSPVQLDLLP